MAALVWARLPEPRRLTVSTRLDADQARREARQFAARLGFDRADAEAIALSVSELAMNLHRYARSGEIELRAVERDQRRGLEVQSRDRGPGISNPDLAMQDGYTTGGGMGSGLPAVRRLMDEFGMQTGEQGTSVVATKWQTRPAVDPQARPSPIRIGVAGRPYPGEMVSGDAYAIHWRGAVCRIAVIDGLGHGVKAAEAAQRAVETLDAHPAATPADALQRCHTALLATRGAAISIAQLDTERHELTYAGIGNVEAHLWHAGHHERLIAYRGIVGSAMRTVRTFTVSLPTTPEPWTFVIHSDGISARANLAELGQPAPDSPQAIAEALLQRFGRQLDDALVVVAQPQR